MARNRAAVPESLAPSAGPGCWARARPPTRTRRPAGTDLGNPGRVRRSQEHRSQEHRSRGERSQAGRSQEQRSCHRPGRRRPGHTPRDCRSPPGHTVPPGRKGHPPTHRDPPGRNPPATRTGPRCHKCRPGHMPGDRVRIPLAPAGRPEHGYWWPPAPHARDHPRPGLLASLATWPVPADPVGRGHPEELAARLPPTDRPVPPRPALADLSPRPSEPRQPASRSIRASRTGLTSLHHPADPQHPAHPAPTAHPPHQGHPQHRADPQHPADPQHRGHPQHPALAAHPPHQTGARRLAHRPGPARPRHRADPGDARPTGRRHPVCAANRHQTNPPGSAPRADAADRADPPRPPRPASRASPRWQPVQRGQSRPAAPVHPMKPSGPTNPRTADQARSRSWPTGRPRRTGRKSRPRPAHWLRHSGRPGHSGSDRRDSAGRHLRARRDSRLADRRSPWGWRLRPARPARHSSAPGHDQRPRPLPAVMLAAGRAYWARHPQRPARCSPAPCSPGSGHRTAGPDRRWPRSSPNRPSARRAVSAGSLAREPITARTGPCERKSRRPALPTPDVIPYPGWTHG